MKQVTILIDNCCDSNQFQVEHGLAMYIEYGTYRLLFDIGQSNAVFRNASKMGIDIGDIDAVVISHGHYDHTGGLKKFLEINSKAKVYINKIGLTPKYKSNRFIGIPNLDKLNPERFQFITGKTRLTEGFFIQDSIGITYPEDTKFNNFYIQSDHQQEPDTFQDECVLVAEEQETVSIITGCSHNGIKNIVESVESVFNKKIKTILGGFHLSHFPPEAGVNLAEFFNKKDIQKLYPNHCTGYHQYEVLKKHFKGITQYAATGTKINLT